MENQKLKMVLKIQALDAPMPPSKQAVHKHKSASPKKERAYKINNKESFP
jgi:hypothetical protein